jgi:hypothetical protein
MTITADWSWWTYFLVGEEVITCGRIVDYDVARRWLRYLKDSGRSRTANPHPPGSDEYAAWLYDTVEATYDELWVDPERQLILPSPDFDAISRGERPESFLVLTDADPESYFRRSQPLTRFLS